VIYLLDTNVIIALLGDKHPAVRDNMLRAKRAGSMLALSSISLHELWYGVAKSDRRGENAEALRKLLATGFEILPFESEDAEAAGNLRGDLLKIGKPIGPYDFLIAGHAIRRNAILVTSNEKEFRRVPGLKWENWAK
jgi:tRNA(fMet)-specific endonuclease VapC